MTASGSLAEPLLTAKATLCDSPTFLARVLASGGASAASHVYLDRVAGNEGLGDLRPYAVLRFSGRGSNVIADGIELSLTVGGGILLVLEAEASQVATHEVGYLDFLDFAGKVIDEMEDLSGHDEYLPFRSELVYPPTRVQRSHQTEDNDYWLAVFLLTWGDQV